MKPGTLQRQMKKCVEHFGEKEGRKQFLLEMREDLGLLERDDDGNLIESVDEYGRPVRAEKSASPADYSLRELAEAIGGREFLDTFDPRSEGPDALDLIEAGPGISPTTFLNTNTFSIATGGLVEAQVLEKFQNETFIGDQLVSVKPTRNNGEKMIGTFGFSSTAGENERKPGQPHARANFGERWIETPELVERAMAVEITQEAVFYDLTNEVMDRAAAVGQDLGYQRELEILDLVCGATDAYNYKGTAYGTYQTSTPWINDFSNPASDYSDVDDALNLFVDMTDPETGKELLVPGSGYTLIHDPSKRATWHHIINGTETREVTNTNTTTLAPGRIGGIISTQLTSSIMRNRLVADGVSASNAKEYWFLGFPKKAFAWMEAWPIRVTQASPNEYAMLDRGLAAAYFANYRGVGAVVEPRYMVRSKN